MLSSSADRGGELKALRGLRKKECVLDCVCVCVCAPWCVRMCLRACMYGTDGKTSQGLLCNWKRREVVIAF